MPRVFRKLANCLSYSNVSGKIRSFKAWTEARIVASYAWASGALTTRLDIISSSHLLLTRSVASFALANWRSDPPRIGLISSYPENMPAYIVPSYHCLIFRFFVSLIFILSSFCVDVPRILVSMAEFANRTQTISSASASTPDIQVFSRIFLIIEKQILKVVVFCLGAVCHTSLNWFSCVQFQNRHPDSRWKVPVDLQICFLLQNVINPLLKIQVIAGGGGGRIRSYPKPDLNKKIK